MTKREAAIISAYTGYLIGESHARHEYIMQLMGKPIWPNELKNQDIANEIKCKAMKDFLAIKVMG